MPDDGDQIPPGDQLLPADRLLPAHLLLPALAALASPVRLRALAALQRRGSTWISELARELSISRPLMHLHLRKLEAARLVTSRLELSADGKALHMFEIAAFDFALTPQTVAAAAATLAS